MATTIQIKCVAGSAVPSGLADGELAINLDNGKLFFGSGSTSINSFRFENLTAENYTVSSSVTNLITQTSSGSTAFGDSSGDTHDFTGRIDCTDTISGSTLRASGDANIGDWLYAGAISIGNPVDPGDNNLQVNGNINVIGNSTLGNGSTDTITITGNTTASGNISAS